MALLYDATATANAKQMWQDRLLSVLTFSRKVLKIPSVLWNPGEAQPRAELHIGAEPEEFAAHAPPPERSHVNVE